MNCDISTVKVNCDISTVIEGLALVVSLALGLWSVYQSRKQFDYETDRFLYEKRLHVYMLMCIVLESENDYENIRKNMPSQEEIEVDILLHIFTSKLCFAETSTSDTKAANYEKLLRKLQSYVYEVDGLFDRALDSKIKELIFRYAEMIRALVEYKNRLEEYKMLKQNINKIGGIKEDLNRIYSTYEQYKKKALLTLNDFRTCCSQFEITDVKKYLNLQNHNNPPIR